ncbi:hypothetical protein AB0F17_34775 [Nonomuraea sp. NPDC026600]|uniref:ParB/RepB/Spo0J family partition protein n=1 Tax=Nonomuraea sp. NPDC026600 TaxID=3155363 RepID=UPI0033D61A9D
MPRAERKKPGAGTGEGKGPAEGSGPLQTTAAPQPTFSQSQAARTSGGAMGISPRGLRPEGTRFNIELNLIAPNPRNPRDDDDWVGEEFEAFADNLEEVGTIHDPVVCSLEAYLGRYPQYTDELHRDYPEAEVVLLAGEGRWRAHLAKGAAKMAVVLRNTLLDKGDFVFTSENNRRRPLNPLQEGLVAWRAHQEDGLTYEDIAKQGGMGTKSRVSKLIALYSRFPEGEAREAIRTGKLPAEGGYHLLTTLKEPSLINQAYKLMESDSIPAKQAARVLMGVSAPLVQEPPASNPASSGPIDGAGNEPHPTPPVSPAKPVEPQMKGNKQEGGPEDGKSAGELGDAVQLNSPASSASGAVHGATPEAQPEVSPAKPRQSKPSAARLAALQRTLASRDYSNPHDITVRLAAAVLTTAQTEQRQIASTAAALSLKDAATPDELAARDAAELVRLADAATFAAAELHLRAHPATEWTPREADYLRRIADTGYEPTPEERDFIRVSLAKLSTPAEVTT